MKIKKLGHCCLLVEDKGIRVLTDPGSYSTLQNEVININYIFITHEHADHVHVESLKKVLENNPNAKIITNTAVKNLLDKENIACEVLEEGGASFGDLKVFAKTCQHADVYDTVTPVQNTGYMFFEKLFYPGDTFLEIEGEIEILALPVAGPWMKISEAIKYALKLKPKHAFPVHDGMLQKGKFGPVHALTEKTLNAASINFKLLNEGEELVFD